MRALALLPRLLAPTVAQARVHPQLYAGLGASFTPGAEHRFGVMLDSSLRVAPWEDSATFEHGPFLQAGWRGGRELWAAAGVVGGYATVERSETAHRAHMQVDAALGAAWWGGHPRLLAGGALGKDLTRSFGPGDEFPSPFYLRAGGAALMGGGGVTPLMHLAVDAAWMPMEDLVSLHER